MKRGKRERACAAASLIPVDGGLRFFSRAHGNCRRKIVRASNYEANGYDLFSFNWKTQLPIESAGYQIESMREGKNVEKKDRSMDRFELCPFDSFNWKDSLVSETQVKLMRIKWAYEGICGFGTRRTMLAGFRENRRTIRKQRWYNNSVWCNMASVTGLRIKIFLNYKK